MSMIIKKWLVEDVGMAVEDIEQDFATGWLFGELLARFSMQPDYDKFDPRGTPGAMINNYTRLQPTFQKLGIQFDTRTVNSLMQEEDGVALKLLYSIKQNLGNLQRDLKKFQHTGTLGKELGAVIPATRGLLEAQQHNTLKEPFKEGKQRLFEESMRAIAGNNKEIMEAMALQRFTDHQYYLELNAAQGDAGEKAMLDAQAANLRGSLLGKMSSQRKDKAAKLQHDDAIHAAILKRKEDIEREEKRVATTLQEKSYRKRLDEIQHASLDVSNGIDAFENNIKRILKSNGGACIDDMDDTKNRKGNIAAVTSKVVEDAEAYMRALKAQRLDDKATKEERAARRRMVLAKLAEMSAQAESQMQEDCLVQALSRASNEEQTINARLWQLRQEKQVMIDDRELREQQYKERRDLDAEAVLEREMDLHRSLREQYEADAAAEAAAWLEAQSARAADKSAQNRSLCEGVAEQLVSLAERTAVYHMEHRSTVPMREFTRWLAMFRKGDPQLGQFRIPTSGSQAGDPEVVMAEASPAEGAEAPDAAAGSQGSAMAVEGPGSAKERFPPEDPIAMAIVQDYINNTGFFAPLQEQPADAVAPSAVPVPYCVPVGQNTQLGKAVGDVQEQLWEAPAPKDLPSISYPLRMAVLGAPCSGKTTVAESLAKQFKLRLLEPEALILEALDEAKEFREAEAMAEATVEAAAAMPEESRSRAASAGPRSKTPDVDSMAADSFLVAGGSSRESKAAAVQPSAMSEVEKIAAAAAEGAGEGAAEGEESGATKVGDEQQGDGSATAQPEHAAAAEEAPRRIPNTKAKLGLEIEEALMAGQDISDDTLVRLVIVGMEEAGFFPLPKPSPEVVAAEEARVAAGAEPRAPPEPEPTQGFVVDGFPRSLAQAKLLERLLTGLDLDSERARVAAASQLAPPPADALPDLNRALRSGLDTVIYLSLDDETLALKRALGRRMDPKEERVYHLEFDPPPADQPGLVARLQQLSDPANDAAQIQRRLTGFRTESGPLEAWLRQFQGLHNNIDGSAPTAEVIAAATECAGSIISAAQAANDSDLQAAAGVKARKGAEEAAEFAELARGRAEAAAQEVLNAKRAELQAQALLVDPKSKVQDAAATEVLKAQASAKCHEQLKSCKTAATDAAGFSERAAFCENQANEALARAQSCLNTAEVSLASAKQAKVALDGATAAYRGAAAAAARAAAAKEAADVAVTQAERFVDAETVAPEDQLELAPPAPDPEETERKAAEAAAAAEDGTAKVVPMPKPLAGALLDEWKAIEKSYMEGLAVGLTALTEEHALTASHFEEMRRSFKDMLRRPDEQPTLVTQFQMDWNAVEDDVRMMPETQGELLLRYEELRDKLWGVCDRKLEEAEAERVRLNNDSYVADHTAMLAQYFASLMQVEMDRFAASINFFRGYLHAKYGVLQPPAPELDLIPPNMLTGEVPADVKDKVDEKSKTVMSFPEQVVALQPKSPMLTSVMKVALATSANVRIKLDPSADDGVKKKPTPASAPKGKKGTAPETPPVDPVIQEAITRELLELGLREVEILEQRTLLLAERAAVTIGEVASTAERTNGQLGQWIQERYKVECSAVAALETVVKEAVWRGHPLGADLVLKQENLTVDLSKVHVAPPEQPPPVVPYEAKPPAALATTSQLLTLVNRFAAVAPNGFVKLAEASEMLCHAIADGTLSSQWLGTSNVAMLAMLRRYDPVFSGYVDWREVVCNLVSASFPSVMQADGAVMAEQVKLLSTMDSDSDGFISEEEWNNSKLWFQQEAFQPGISESDLEAEFAVVDPELRKPKFDSAAMLKQVLWTMFSSQNLPEDSPTGAAAKAAGAPRMDFQAVLLYLCADRHLARGVEKACCLVSSSPSPRVKISAEQLYRMAHPMGSTEGGNIHCTPLDVESVKEMVQAIYISRGGGGDPEEVPAVKAEELLYSAGGAKARQYLLPRYQWKDAFAATRLS